MPLRGSSCLCFAKRSIPDTRARPLRSSASASAAFANCDPHHHHTYRPRIRTSGKMRRLGSRPFRGAPMLHHMMTLPAALLSAALLVPVEAVAQDKTGATWPNPVPTRGPVAEKDKKPAPRRTINGMWSALRVGNQSGGVQLKPNNGKPENELPYTPYGLQVYRSHNPLEGKDSVAPADNNDPRTKCEPLGFPRYNHYDLGIQVFQDEQKVAMLYHFDNRWRMIWTDGRPLPKVVDGGVEIVEHRN